MTRLERAAAKRELKGLKRIRDGMSTFGGMLDARLRLLGWSPWTRRGMYPEPTPHTYHQHLT